MRKAPFPEDHELIKEILRGEISAFEKLIDKYRLKCLICDIKMYCLLQFVNLSLFSFKIKLTA
jgi:hypothetical protein